jgi:hypothetical protein
MVMPAIGSAIAGTLTSKVVDSVGPKKPDPSTTAGISSSVDGSKESSQAPVVPEVSGSEANKYAKQAFDAAFTKGLDSVINPRMNASEAGKYQRDYLASAFPEMNPWERAGATATQAGVQAGQQQNQKDMLNMQLSNQKDIAEIQSDTAKDVAKINNFPAMSKLDLEKMNLASKNVLTQYQSSTEAWRAVSEEFRSKNIEIEGAKLKAMIPQIQAMTEKLQTGNSDYGRMYTDIRNMLRNGTNLKGGELEAAAQSLAALMYGGEKLYDKLPSFSNKTGGVGSSVRSGNNASKVRGHQIGRPVHK